MNTYTPHPINTTDVVFSTEMKALWELLVENVHEIWSAGRIADGWQYSEEHADESDGQNHIETQGVD